MGAVTAHASEAAPADINWDGEYDVVVMGLGAAGCNAAVAAYEEGVKVLAVEKAAEGSAPCNSNAAGQNVIATDDADALYAYFSALMGNFENWDEEALRAMCEGARRQLELGRGRAGHGPRRGLPRRGRGRPRGTLHLGPQRRRLGHGPRRLHAAVERVPRARGQRPLLQHPGGRQDL